MGDIGLILSLARAANRLTLPPAAVDAIGLRLITLASVGALLLPALGPLVDHHFAERRLGSPCALVPILSRRVGEG